MKIKIVPFRKDWKNQFDKISKELHQILQELKPIIEHIGSTSIQNLSAKPIIDIQVGIKDKSQFDIVVELMKNTKDYIYYEAFNKSMPNRRLFVKLDEDSEKLKVKNTFKTLEEIPHDRLNTRRIAHIHVWKLDSDDWIRHIAFRDYLKYNNQVKQEYEKLKLRLSKQDWTDGMEYNLGKDKFIKRIESDAIKWFTQKNKNFKLKE